MIGDPLTMHSLASKMQWHSGESQVKFKMRWNADRTAPESCVLFLVTPAGEEQILHVFNVGDAAEALSRSVYIPIEAWETTKTLLRAAWHIAPENSEQASLIERAVRVAEEARKA